MGLKARLQLGPQRLRPSLPRPGAQDKAYKMVQTGVMTWPVLLWGEWKHALSSCFISITSYIDGPSWRCKSCHYPPLAPRAVGTQALALWAAPQTGSRRYSCLSSREPCASCSMDTHTSSQTCCVLGISGMWRLCARVTLGAHSSVNSSTSGCRLE
ncbi:Protocadherin Alpha-1 [Manis pentadactyla]|nr:Protocadherin Alpha-1 [Manis pentadactyla]